MPIAVRLPDLAHWKAQVECQAGCPVATFPPALAARRLDRADM